MAHAETPDAHALLKALPPLPSPDWSTLRSEYLWCAATVGGVFAVCAGVAHAVTLAAMQRCSPAIRDGCLWAIYAQSCLAFLCLAALHLLDPGIVRRSPKNCLPLPPAVAQALRADAPDWSSLQVRGQNIDASSSDPRSYCVRCFVWRPAPVDKAAPPSGRVAAALTTARAWLCEGNGRAHHCSACQRCVCERVGSGRCAADR